MEVKKPRRSRKSVAAKPKLHVRFEGVGFFDGEARRPFSAVVAELQDKYNSFAEAGPVTISFLEQGIVLGQRVVPNAAEAGAGNAPPTGPAGGSPTPDPDEVLVNEFIESLPMNPLDKKTAVRAALKSWFDRRGLQSFMQLKEAAKKAQVALSGRGDVVGAAFFEELLKSSDEIRLDLN